MNARTPRASHYFTNLCFSHSAPWCHLLNCMRIFQTGLQIICIYQGILTWMHTKAFINRHHKHVFSVISKLWNSISPVEMVYIGFTYIKVENVQGQTSIIKQVTHSLDHPDTKTQCDSSDKATIFRCCIVMMHTWALYLLSVTGRAYGWHFDQCAVTHPHMRCVLTPFNYKYH